MPDGFDSSDDRDTGAASEDHSEREGPLAGTSPSQRNDFEHEALDSDGEMSVDSPGRARQEFVDQMENHNPYILIPETTVSGSMSRARYRPGRASRKRRRRPNIPIDPNVNSDLPELSSPPGSNCNREHP